MTNKKILDEIAKLPANWHGSGSLSMSILEAILHYCEKIGSINLSAETGTGKSTLLFSNISKRHIVFTLNNWNSLKVTQDSDLLVSQRVEFVVGPTQLTLPKYDFSNKNFDVVLLDGPHGYPFPDLEYYYFYPFIKKGGLLILDDIHIPSVKRMLDILKKDNMWNLIDVVQKKLAILERTEAEMIEPYSDSWWLQGYNKSLIKKLELKTKIKSLIPTKIANLLKKIKDQ